MTRTLIFPVAALDLFVDILLDVALEDAGPGWLVEASGFQDVGGVDPVVLSAAHNMFFQVGSELVFVDGNLEESKLLALMQAAPPRGKLTPLYVALYIPVLGWSAAILSGQCSGHWG